MYKSWLRWQPSCLGDFYYYSIDIELPPLTSPVTVDARDLLAVLATGYTAPILQCPTYALALLAFCLITTPQPGIDVEVMRLRRGFWTCSIKGWLGGLDELHRTWDELARFRHSHIPKDLLAVVAPVVHCLGGVVWPDGTAAVPQRFRLVNYTPHAVGRVRRQGHGCSPARMPIPRTEPAPADDDTVTLVSQDGERVVLPQSFLEGSPFFQCVSNFREGRTGQVGLPCDGATLRALAAHTRGSAQPANYDVPLLELAAYLLWDDLVAACVGACVASATLDAVALARLAHHPSLPPASAELVRGIVRRQRAATAAHVYACMALHNRAQ